MLRRLALVALAAPAAAIALGGVISPLRLAQVQRAAPPGAEEDYLRSVEGARGALDEPVIGFLAERPVDVTQGGPVELYYYLAQYALVPVLIEPRPARRLVLVVDPRPGRLEALLARPEARLVRALGPGLALVETRPGIP